MTVMTCTLCGAGFLGRSDAVYCSAACRQKAHRARTARRTADLRERLTARSQGHHRRETATPLQRAFVASLQRAREQVDRSQELCRTAERRMQRNAAIRRELASQRRAGMRPASSAKGVPWLTD